MPRFYFWETVLLNTEDDSFPSNIAEERGCFVGISDNVGHDMNFTILNSSNNNVENRSKVMSANDDKSPNLRADHIASPEVIKSLYSYHSL